MSGRSRRTRDMVRAHTNACELAQLYEEPKEVLIDLVEKQFAPPNPAFTTRRSRRRPRAVGCPTKDRQGVLAF